MSPRIRRILVRTALVLGAGVVLAWGGVNALLQTPRVRGAAQSSLAGLFGPEARFGRLWWVPWSGFCVSGIEIPAPEGAASHGPFLHVDRVEVRPDYGALRHRQILPRRVRIVNPALRLVRSADGRWLLPFPVPAPVAPPALAAAGEDAGRPQPGAAPLPEVAAASPSPVPAPLTPPATPAAGPASPTVGPPAATPVAASGPPLIPPPPDIRLDVTGASLAVIDESRPGAEVLEVRGGEASVTPSGGRVTVGSGGIRLLGTRSAAGVEIPLAWVGPELQATVVRRVSGDSSLTIMASVAAGQGLPVSLGIEARKAPPAWFAEWAGFDLGGHWQGASVTMAARSAALARSPRAWGSVGQVEVSSQDLPGSLQAFWQSLEMPGLDRLDGPFVAQAQWMARNGLVDVPQFRVLAGGILFGGRAALGPGGVIQGETVAAFGPGVRDAVRKLEDRLPTDLAFHFDQTQDVQLPDGRKESWQARPLALAGQWPNPRIGLWQGHPSMTLAEILESVRASRRPADPDSVELLPIRTRTGDE